MAITFPRDLLQPIRTVTFDLMHFVKGAGMGGPVIESRDPLWMAEYETPPLTNAQLAEWRAWWASMRGGVRQFYAYDPKTPYPLLYPNGVSGLTRAGGGAFDGTTTITAIAARSITLGTLPVGFVISAGDKLGLVEGGLRSLHIVVEAGTANGSGVATVAVEPPIATTLFTTAGAGNLVRPVVKMRPKPDSWQSRTSPIPEPISFSAEQQGY
jgi:hypothetical protein